LSMSRLNFSGHESFHCRALWLKKGYDYIKNGHHFNQADGVVHLGVGKNMMTAIQYWMAAFNLLDADRQLTLFSEYILGNEGKDPYLEDPATLWLLHYYLIKNSVASTYSLVFNEFRKERIEFTREQLLRFIKRKCEENKTVFNSTTIKKDIAVFLRTYLKPQKVSGDIEDHFSGLLADCRLIEEVSGNGDKANGYRIVNSEKDEIPGEVILFAILDHQDLGRSVSFNTLLLDMDSVGSIFALNAEGLIRKIKELQEKNSGIVYTDDAGIRQVQFRKKMDKWAVLNDYYQG
jgi:hypothetical protein